MNSKINFFIPWVCLVFPWLTSNLHLHNFRGKSDGPPQKQQQKKQKKKQGLRCFGLPSFANENGNSNRP